MRFRDVVLTTFILVAIFFGVWLVLGPTIQNVLFASSGGSIRFNPNDFLTWLSNYLIYLSNLLKDNPSLVFYVVLALIGILMVALVISSAKSAPPDSTQAMLELLRQEKEKAENLAKLKSEFLNQVSHELRTPLAVIIGYIECMTDGLYGQLEPRHQEILQGVSKQSTHLKNMIDQILIFSRLEASRHPVRIKEIAIHILTSELKDTFEFLCRQKRLGLTWDVPARLGTMQTDPDRLKEIVGNLLGNAVKYTDKGRIGVTVREDGVTDSIIIEVADTGMGIPEESLATIFEPFVQVHKTSTEHSRGGIGLGLSIVKRHVEQINGSISVESELGKGSVFRVTLPRNYDASVSRYKKLLRFLRLSRRVGNRPVATELTKNQPVGHITDAQRLN